MPEIRLSRVTVELFKLAPAVSLFRRANSCILPVGTVCELLNEGIKLHDPGCCRHRAEKHGLQPMEQTAGAC